MPAQLVHAHHRLHWPRELPVQARLRRRRRRPLRRCARSPVEGALRRAGGTYARCLTFCAVAYFASVPAEHLQERDRRGRVLPVPAQQLHCHHGQRFVGRLPVQPRLLRLRRAGLHPYVCGHLPHSIPPEKKKKTAHPLRMPPRKNPRPCPHVHRRVPTHLRLECVLPVDWHERLRVPRRLHRARQRRLHPYARGKRLSVCAKSAPLTRGGRCPPRSSNARPACPQNTYKSEIGSSTCNPCPVNSTTVGEAVTSRAQCLCNPGTSGNTGAAEDCTRTAQASCAVAPHHASGTEHAAALELFFNIFLGSAQCAPLGRTSRHPVTRRACRARPTPTRPASARRRSASAAAAPATRAPTVKRAQVRLPLPRDPLARIAVPHAG